MALRVVLLFASLICLVGGELTFCCFPDQMQADALFAETGMRGTMAIDYVVNRLYIRPDDNSHPTQIFDLNSGLLYNFIDDECIVENSALAERFTQCFRETRDGSKEHIFAGLGNINNPAPRAYSFRTTSDSGTTFRLVTRPECSCIPLISQFQSGDDVTTFIFSEVSETITDDFIYTGLDNCARRG